MSNYKKLLQKVDTFFFDYDGVMTDGRVILLEKGQPLRMANVKDGYVLQLAVKLGFNVVIISGGFHGPWKTVSRCWESNMYSWALKIKKR